MIPVYRRALTNLPRIRVLVGAIVLLGNLSCAPVLSRTTMISESVPSIRHDPDELFRNLVERSRHFGSLRSLATVHYSAWNGKANFQEAVLVQRPDRLRLETLSNLGAVLIVTAVDDEVVGFHPQESLFYRGRSSKENLLRYTRIPLELGEITSLLLGLPPMDPKSGWKAKGNALIWERSTGQSDAVLFDAALGVPVRWERLSADQEIELAANFSNYLPTPAGTFPLMIVLEAPRQQLRLQIRYQEPELNVSLPNSLFVQQKPDHVREVSLDSLGG